MQGSWLSARRSTPVMNRLHGLWSVGTVMGGLIAVQAAAGGVPIFAHLLAVTAMLALALAYFAPRLLPTDGPIEPGEPGEAESAGAGDESAAPDGAGRREVSVGRSLARQSLLLGLWGAAAVTMELTTSDWAPFRLADDLGVGAGLVGLSFVAFTAGMVTGRLAGDWIEVRLGTRTLTMRAALVAAFGLTIATVVPFDRLVGEDAGTTVPMIGSLIGFYIAALGVSVIFPRLYDLAAKAPGPPGRGLGALTAGTRLSSLATPVVVGGLANTSLSVGTAVAIVTLPACAVVLSSRS